MSVMVASPLQGTRAVREPSGLWTVVSDGKIVQTGCTHREAIEIEAVELAAFAPCEGCSSLTPDGCAECIGIETFGG